ncbi:MAG: Uma2 family endonuclease [Bryobacteraceae bacterium]|nr:Uma2 family endonuclease [Bryobacteraceae bacterium]
MAVKTPLSPAEYLATAFEGPDREYVRGEIVERNLGNTVHSRLQARLIALLAVAFASKPVEVFAELRHRLEDELFRIPDVSVHPRGLSDEVPSTPPIVAAEIVSPDDRHSDIMAKLEEYARWGVEHIWLIEPRTQRCYEYRASGLEAAAALAVPSLGIEIRAADLFAAS